MDVADIPNVFTPLRNKLEKNTSIRSPLPVPEASVMGRVTLPTPKYDENLLPTLVSLGYSEADAERHPQSALPLLPGGETAALSRVEQYMFNDDRLKTYFDTRNGLIGEGYSTKFSPWLAAGCVSPRFIASECRRYEEGRGISNKSTYEASERSDECYCGASSLSDDYNCLVASLFNVCSALCYRSCS